MKKRFAALMLVCVLVFFTVTAFAGSYDYIDPSILIGAEELPWITLVTANDSPAWDDTTLDLLFLEQTGEKYTVPENPSERADWMMDIFKNKTGGKGDFAIAKCSDEDFLRVAYDLDEWSFFDYKFHRYSDYTRIMIKGLTAYVYWTTGTDAIQHGAKVVYDNDTGVFTVTEFNLLTMDGSPTDAIAAAYFGYLRNTCNYAVNTKSGKLLFRAEPSTDAEIIAKIPKGGEVSSIYDYVYRADNGYNYVPARYDMDGYSHYGWIAQDYLGMNERVDAMMWVGRKPMELEYPSATEILEKEGKEPVTVTVELGNKPKKGDAFKKGEKVLLKLCITNNTFTDIPSLEIKDERSGGDMIVSVPWRRSVYAEYSYKITAEDAAAGSIEQVSSVEWTDDDGTHQAVSVPLTIATVSK